MAVRALLLDHDGTLVDSYEGIEKCLRLTCREMGFPEMTADEVRASIGPTLEERFTALWGAQAAEEAARIYRAHYKVQGARGTRLIPGVRETLETLARRGVRMACVSNKAWFFCEEQLAHVGLSRLIEAVFGNGQGYAPKPDPEMLRTAMKRLDAAPAEALMIGDTVTDIQAARNASVPAWIIEGPYSQAAEIARAKPDKYLGNFSDILEFL